MIQNKNKIKEIKLTKCNIGDDGGIQIFKTLENFSNLISLNVANNKLTSKSVDALINLLKSNRSLKTIYITNNELSVQDKEKIRSYSGTLTNINCLKIFI